MNEKAHAPDDRDLAKWLHRTLRKLKHGELPPESWERGLSPLEDSAAQRRIAALIAEIAAKPRENKKENAKGSREKRR